MKIKKQPHVPWELGLMAARKAPRCQAKAKSTGQRCRMPAVRGKTVCRLHGGARGSGAPEGNQNALRHGLYTKEAIIERRRVNALIRQFNECMNDYKESSLKSVED